MRTGDMIKVRFIEKDDPIALRNGKIYDARVLKPTKKENAGTESNGVKLNERIHTFW